MNTLNPKVSLGGALRLAAAPLLLRVTALAQKFGAYDLVVPNSSTSVVTTIDGAGRLLPTDRSFVIGIESGTHGPLVFSNWTGTENFPIIIVNKGGKAVVSDDGVNYKDGIQLSSCVWVQMRGDNLSSIRYGIEVVQAGNQAGKSRVGINILGLSGHVEPSPPSSIGGACINAVGLCPGARCWRWWTPSRRPAVSRASLFIRAFTTIPGR